MDELNLNRCSQEHFDRAMELLKLARSCEQYGDGFVLWVNYDSDFIYLYNAEKDIMLMQNGNRCEEYVRMPSCFYEGFLKDLEKEDKTNWEKQDLKAFEKAKKKAEESKFFENLHKEAKKGV